MSLAVVPLSELEHLNCCKTSDNRFCSVFSMEFKRRITNGKQMGINIWMGNKQQWQTMKYYWDFNQPLMWIGDESSALFDIAMSALSKYWCWCFYAHCSIDLQQIANYSFAFRYMNWLLCCHYFRVISTSHLVWRCLLDYKYILFWRNSYAYFDDKYFQWFSWRCESWAPSQMTFLGKCPPSSHVTALVLLAQHSLEDN